jgi:diphthamide synthase subunit DPH2
VAFTASHRLKDLGMREIVEADQVGVTVNTGQTHRAMERLQVLFCRYGIVMAVNAYVVVLRERDRAQKPDQQGDCHEQPGAGVESFHVSLPTVQDGWFYA